MKILNWKYVPVGRMIATACAAGLLLFTMSANASPTFGKELLTFDTLESDVPFGYGNLIWSNFFVLDGDSYVDGESGYKAGVISSPNVLYNSYGDPASISSEYAFILNSAYLTAAWNDNLQVEVQGYFLNRLVYTRTYTLSAVAPKLIVFPGILVTKVVFTSSGGTLHEGYDGNGEHFATDNLSVTVFPFLVNKSAGESEGD